MFDSRKATIEGFRVPWSVRFFLRRGDPHVLSAFLEVSRLLEKPLRKKSPAVPTALTATDRELVERIYVGDNFKDREMARLGSLWHLTPRRKRGRLYAQMMITMMSEKGASKKNTSRLSKLLQLEKGLGNNALYFLTKLAKQQIRRGGRALWRGVQALRRGGQALWRFTQYATRFVVIRCVLPVFLYVALKTGFLSFLFHSRTLGKIHDWTQLEKRRKKMETEGFPQKPRKTLEALFSPFRLLIETAVIQARHFSIAHYASLKNPDVPHYIGGHGGMTHSDEGALVFLKKQFSVKSMMDVGCGTGGQVDVARKNGIEAFGVDGDDSLKFTEPWFFIHDFAKGHLACKRRFDLVWSVEFLEHVEEKYQPFYMSLFQQARVVACTAAPPGVEGYHHVNCRPVTYWLKVFKQYGFAFDAKNNERMQKSSNMQTYLMRNRGLLFVKT